MAALPYMQLYVADYLADTTHLTAEEHGAYLLILFSYWQTGKPLRIDRLSTVARVSNDRWNSVADTLSEFFHITATHWVHFRVEADLAAVHSKVVTASNAGKASARARALKKQQELNDRSTTVAIPLQRKSNHIDTDTYTEDQNHSLCTGEQGLAELRPEAHEPCPLGAPQEQRFDEAPELAPKRVDPKAPVEMTLDWMPEANLLKTYCVHFGVPIDLFTRVAIAPFTAHHETGGGLNTQAKWVSLLVKWVKDDKSRASNVRQLPVRRHSTEPDFDDIHWAKNLGGPL